MQLNEILEENSIKTISQKTNISEENLEILFAGNFDLLRKVKTLGFISIIEREFNADLSALKKQALEYYETHMEDDGIAIDIPVIEQKKGKSGLFIFVVLALLALASWYFMTQFDKEKLRGLLPFNEEKTVNVIKEEVDNNPDLSIEQAITDKKETQSTTASDMPDTKKREQESNGTGSSD